LIKKNWKTYTTPEQRKKKKEKKDVILLASSLAQRRLESSLRASQKEGEDGKKGGNKQHRKGRNVRLLPPLKLGDTKAKNRSLQSLAEETGFTRLRETMKNIN